MKLFKNIALAALAIVAFASCDAQQTPKFDAKEYAQRKTDRIDQVVDLTDAQQKEVYNLFLEQGKQIKKNIKEFKKECGEVKCPDGKRAKCNKPADCTKECKKAECDKAAKCDKVKCQQKAECKGDCATCERRAECKKAECTKDCKKAECKGDCATCERRAECKKECKKAECTKDCKKAECKGDCATCERRAECKKECKKAACDKAAKCDKARRPHRHHHGINPEEMKALYGKISAILTPEQVELLKAHRAQRFHCAPNAEQCCPSEK